MALESSARVAVTNAINNKEDLGGMLGMAAHFVCSCTQYTRLCGQQEAVQSKTAELNCNVLLLISKVAANKRSCKEGGLVLCKRRLHHVLRLLQEPPVSCVAQLAPMLMNGTEQQAQCRSSTVAGVCSQKAEEGIWHELRPHQQPQQRDHPHGLLPQCQQ